MIRSHEITPWWDCLPVWAVIEVNVIILSRGTKLSNFSALMSLQRNFRLRFIGGSICLHSLIV